MLVSIIVPCYNEQESLPLFYREITRVAGEMKESHNADFEFIFVDDGSKDNTLAIARELHKQDKRVRYISFSRNFGKEAGILAGLEAAKGDYVAMMDADLQDPPALLPRMLDALLEEDYDCAATRRTTREGEPPIRSFFARMFYRIINKISDADIVIAGGDAAGMAAAIQAVAEGTDPSKILVLEKGGAEKSALSGESFNAADTDEQAEAGIAELKDKVDSLVIIPNERLKHATDQKITFANAFEIADDVLRQAVQSISDLIRDTGFINLDFADVTAIMKNAGMAHMGVGRAAGKGKAEEAAKMAISSPLLETSINGAKGVLINVTGSMDIGLEEVETAANLVQEAAHPEANIIFGAAFDDTLEDELRVTVIATGFDADRLDAAVNYNFKSGVTPAADSGDKGVGDDDDYFDIMKIFNQK